MCPIMYQVYNQDLRIWGVTLPDVSGRASVWMHDQIQYIQEKPSILTDLLEFH